MDHMIKEKFIVTDGEKVTDEIYRAVSYTHLTLPTT